MRLSSWGGILKGERDTRIFLPLPLWRLCTEERPGDDQQEGGHMQVRKRDTFHQKPTLTAPWSWTYGLPNFE